MSRLLFLLLFPLLLSAQEPNIEPALRTKQPINAIRKIFYQIPLVNAERMGLGFSPVINLSIGQPHIPLQMHAVDSLIGYLENLKYLTVDQLCIEMGYGHASGLLETRNWISALYTHSYPEVSGGFSPNEVMVANGATGALTNVLHVLIEGGDEVAIFAPYFAAYENQVKHSGGKVVAIPFLSYRSQAEALEATLASHPKIKAFLWNDPNNPLGTKASREELRELALILEKYPHLAIIHDDVYRDIVQENAPLSLLNVAPELKARSFVIRSIAKDILGAPGIRGGMVSAPIAMQTKSGSAVNFIELMSNEQLRDITGVSVLVQKIIGFAIEQKLSGANWLWEEKMKREYGENTQMFSSALKNLGLPPLAEPKGAFYVMLDVSSLLGKKVPDRIGAIDDLQAKVNTALVNDLDVAALFLHAVGVAMVPGSGFGADRGSLRVSCARSKEQLLDAVERIEVVLKALE